MTPEERAHQTHVRIMGAGTGGEVYSIILDEVRAAIEERDREWARHLHEPGSDPAIQKPNEEAWVFKKLCDPEFAAGYLHARQNIAIEEEREAQRERWASLVDRYAQQADGEVREVLMTVANRIRHVHNEAELAAAIRARGE